MRFYWPIAKVDAEQRMVWGYASTEALDDQGEIVKREALEVALSKYMLFANIREMHQPSAIGIAKEANIDDKGLYLAAKIVDHEAWEKVVQGVYKGFSIGGRVTARDPADRNVITGLALTEISVVDRPANPEAVFDCWKTSDGHEMSDNTVSFNPEPRVWACGQFEHYHHQKNDFDDCIRKRTFVSLAAPESPKSNNSAPADAISDRGSATCEYLRRGEVIERWSTTDELTKIQRQNSELVKLVTALSAVVGQIATQVNDIAHTPLPPQTIAYPGGLAGSSKNEDIVRGRPPASDEDIVKRFAKLSPTDQTMLLIKAAYRNPMRPGGNQADPDAGGRAH